MKRLLFILITVILVSGLVISGCTEKEETATTTPTPTETTTPTPTETPTPTATETPTPTTTPEPAAFTLSNLSIQPAEIDPEEEVTISVLLSNTGESKGKYEVNCIVNDVTIAYKTITLDGGAEQTVTFTTTGTSAGTITVKVNDLSGTFTVKAPPKPTTGGTTVYVSVSVDGELLVAAEPVTIFDMTVEAAIKAAHEEFYPDGLGGYTAGIDPTWNMYLVTKCWGVENTPYVVLNGAPLSAGGVAEFVDTTAVAANDNVIICTGSDTSTISPVSLTATLSGDSVTVTATAWTLSFTTFAYSSAPLADANVVDPATGASLGTTDADGSTTVTVPESGVVAIEGMAAIRVIPAEGEAATGISWEEAKNHIGETTSVTGPIVDSTVYEDQTILGMGVSVMDSSTVGIVFITADLDNYDEDLYIGKTITVTGTLILNPYGGANIEVTDPSQVEVVE